YAAAFHVLDPGPKRRRGIIASLDGNPVLRVARGLTPVMQQMPPVPPRPRQPTRRPKWARRTNTTPALVHSFSDFPARRHPPGMLCPGPTSPASTLTFPPGYAHAKSLMR